MAKPNNINDIELHDFSTGQRPSESDFDKNPLLFKSKINAILDYLAEVTGVITTETIIGNAEEIETIKGAGWTTETLKGLKDLIDSLTSTVNANETDIETKVSNHKISNDHDYKYYTETEIDSFISALEGVGHTTETIKENKDLIDTIQGQIDALNDTYSTDAERINAINQAISDYEQADNDLTTLINTKANSSDVYTKSEVDTKVFDTSNLSDRLITSIKIGLQQFKNEHLENGMITADKLHSTLLATVDDVTVNARFEKLETGTYSTEVSENSNLFSLTPNTVDGFLKDVRVEGRTLTNLWNMDTYILANGTTFTEIANGIKITDTTDSWGYVEFTVDLQVGVEYTLLLNSHVLTGSQGGGYRIGANDSSQYHLTFMGEGAYRTKFTTIDTPTKITLYCNYGATDGITTESEFTDIILLEGDYTNIDVNYFENTQSVNDVQVASVGKNLFDKNKLIYDWTINHLGIIVSVPDTFCYHPYIQVLPNTVYSTSALGNAGGSTLAFYDMAKNKISLLTLNTLNSNDNQFTTPSNCHYIQVSVLISDVDEKTVMITRTDSTLPYEPFKSTIIDIPYELESVPNGTKDEIRQTSDGWERVQRISDEYILQDADFEDMYTANPNNDIAFLNIFDNQKIIIGTSTILKHMLVDGMAEVPSIDADIITNVGKFTFSGSSGKLLFIVAKGTTLADVKSSLIGTKIYYQLATPTITPLELPFIPCYENGTITVDSTIVPTFSYKAPLNRAEMLDQAIATVQYHEEILIRGDGERIEKGSATISLSNESYGSTNIIFKKAFAKVPYILVSSQNSFYNASYYGATTTGLTIDTRHNDNVIGIQSIIVHYIAIGE